jgi:hypothetical protein
MSLQRAEGLDIRLVNSFHFETEEDVAALEAMISACTKKRTDGALENQSILILSFCHSSIPETHYPSRPSLR